MIHASFNNRFHPVREWLEGLRWDGVERIDTWLMKAFGVADTAYHRAVGWKTMIGAVRRIMHPGSKFDTMLVVEGDQGIGKSTVFRALFGNAWFTDDMHKNLESIEAGRSIQGKWCVEMAEIQQILKAETEVVKDWLSKQADRIRPHYLNTPRDFPRQTIFVGTTNEEQWLRDPTGNRRFWPVKALYADPVWIRKWREQLWAEAVVRERLGEDHPRSSVYLDNVLLQTQATDEQRKREFVDPWRELILDWVQGKDRVTTEDILLQAVVVHPKDLKDYLNNRVAKILRKEGWTRKKARAPGSDRPRWFFFAPGTAGI